MATNNPNAKSKAPGGTAVRPNVKKVVRSIPPAKGASGSKGSGYRR